CPGRARENVGGRRSYGSEEQEETPFKTPRPREQEKEGVLEALQHAGQARGTLNCSRPRVKLLGRLGTKLQ
ncbi:hypothetical protein KI387_037701, partial [Taxus chinensis]